MAENGVEALALLACSYHDIVFMDCQMPVLDGFETTRRRRQSEAPGRHTTIVAMTASAMSGDRERCLSAGMDDYITKSTSQAELDEALGRWLTARAT